MKQVIDNQTANDMFNEFCESWNIDNDIDNMNTEDKDSFEDLKSKIFTAITDGRLIFNPEKSILIYTISNDSEKEKGKVLNIRRPNGRGLRQIDRAKEGKNVERAYYLIAAMSGVDFQYVDELAYNDIKPLMGIAQLFLAS